MRIQAVLAWCRHHLLSFLALAFMLGITCAYRLSRQLEAAPLAGASSFLACILMVSAVLCLATMLILKPHSGLVLAGLPLFFCSGLFHGWQALHSPADSSLVSHQLEQRSKISLHGRVLDMVEQNGRFGRCTLQAQGLLHHTAIGKRQGFQPALGKVALRLRGQLPQELKPGTAVMALGWAERPKSRPERGAADPALLAAARDIDATLWLQSPDALIILAESEPGIGGQLRFASEQYRQRVARFVQEQLPPDLAGVYQALLIGSYQGLSEEQLEQFKQNGVMHILAMIC